MNVNITVEYIKHQKLFIILFIHSIIYYRLILELLLEMWCLVYLLLEGYISLNSLIFTSIIIVSNLQYISLCSDLFFTMLIKNSRQTSFLHSLTTVHNGFNLCVPEQFDCETGLRLFPVLQVHLASIWRCATGCALIHIHPVKMGERGIWLVLLYTPQNERDTFKIGFNTPIP